MDDLKKQLEEQKLEATWHALKPHMETGALVLVSEELALADVGLILALDQVSTLEEWMGEGLVAKPSAEQLEAWEEEQMKLFWMLIVQPFVLIQELSASEAHTLIQEKIQA